MVQPVVVKCGHSFCVNCIKRISEGPVAKRKCPVCRGDMDCQGNLPHNVELMAITSSFPAKCTLCSWAGRVEEILGHTASCEMKEISCVFPGCSSVFLRKDLMEHKRQCSFRTVTCNECFDIVASPDLPIHRREKCSHRKVPCPFYRDGNEAHYVTW